MLEANADRLVAFSRRVLSERLHCGTESFLEKALAEIHGEMVALEHLADEHPGEIQYMVPLVMAWVNLQELLKSKLH